VSQLHHFSRSDQQVSLLPVLRDVFEVVAGSWERDLGQVMMAKFVSSIVRAETEQRRFEVTKSRSFWAVVTATVQYGRWNESYEKVVPSTGGENYNPWVDFDRISGSVVAWARQEQDLAAYRVAWLYQASELLRSQSGGLALLVVCSVLPSQEDDCTLERRLSQLTEQRRESLFEVMSAKFVDLHTSVLCPWVFPSRSAVEREREEEGVGESDGDSAPEGSDSDSDEDVGMCLVVTTVHPSGRK
jgi:hypothetical protein